MAIKDAEAFSFFCKNYHSFSQLINTSPIRKKEKKDLVSLLLHGHISDYTLE